MIRFVNLLNTTSIQLQASWAESKGSHYLLEVPSLFVTHIEIYLQGVQDNDALHGGFQNVKRDEIGEIRKKLRNQRTINMAASENNNFV